MKLRVYPAVRCFQTIPDIIMSPFVSPRKFEELFQKWAGTDDVLYAYRARTGLFHLLRFLKSNGVKRVVVPSYTCKEVVHPIKKAGLDILFVDNDLGTLGIDGIDDRLGKSDAVLMVNYFGLKSIPSGKVLESGAVLIEDNASFFKQPSSYADFTLYSFGKGKEFSSSEGGAVVVNNKKYSNFVKISLDRTGFFTELGRFFDYMIWRLGTLRFFYRLSRKIMSSIKGDERITFGDIEGTGLSMCSVSRKLAYRQLMKMGSLQKKSGHLWKLFYDNVQDIQGIKILGRPSDLSNFFSVNMLVEQRDELKTFLEKHGIFASIPWNYHIGKKLTSEKFPNANKIYSELLQLKIDPTYMKDDDVEYISKYFREFYGVG